MTHKVMVQKSGTDESSALKIPGKGEKVVFN